MGATARLAGSADATPVRLAVASRPSAGRAGADATVRLGFVEPATFAVETPVEVDIDAEERVGALFVPADALVRQGEETVVFVASAHTAQRRPVTTGLADEERVEITSGLKAGELVITRGHTGLPDGAAITVDTSAR